MDLASLSRLMDRYLSEASGVPAENRENHLRGLAAARALSNALAKAVPAFAAPGPRERLARLLEEERR